MLQHSAAQETLSGVALPPASALRHKAEVRLFPNGELVCAAGEQRFAAHIHELRISEALGNIPRSVEFANGWSFTADNQAALNEWLKKHRTEGWISRLESNRKAIVLAVLVTLIFGYWMLNDGIPAISHSIAKALPESVGRYVGEKTLALLDDGAYFSESEVAEDRRVKLKALMSEIAMEHAGSGNPEPNLIFRQWQGQPNAFALADGTIILTDSMVGLAEDDSELESVLRHEMGHLYYHDVMTQLVQASIMSILVAYLVGDIAGVGDLLASTAALGISMGYSRQAEIRADEFAAKGMHRRHGTIEGMLRIYERFSAIQPDVASWLSSHPDTRHRVEHIKALHGQP